MTEKELIDLGFNKVEVSPEESGIDYSFYFYELMIGNLTILSNEDDLVKNEEWKIEMLDYDLWTDDYDVAKDLITALKRMNYEKG